MISKRVTQDNIKELKMKLETKKIKVEDLTIDEIELLKSEYRNEIFVTNKKIDEINKKIKDIKIKIDNWNKN